MSIVTSKMNVSTLDNNIRIKRVLKQQRDNLTKLVDLGLASINCVSDHEIWQAKRPLVKDYLPESSTLPNSNVDKAIKAYQKRLDEAISYDLIKKTR